jgi:hypothetical protein
MVQLLALPPQLPLTGQAALAMLQLALGLPLVAAQVQVAVPPHDPTT